MVIYCNIWSIYGLSMWFSIMIHMVNIYGPTMIIHTMILPMMIHINGFLWDLPSAILWFIVVNSGCSVYSGYQWFHNMMVWINHILVGGWTPPLWKKMSSSVGMMRFPIKKSPKSPTRYLGETLRIWVIWQICPDQYLSRKHVSVRVSISSTPIGMVLL